MKASSSAQPIFSIFHVSTQLIAMQLRRKVVRLCCLPSDYKWALCLLLVHRLKSLTDILPSCYYTLQRERQPQIRKIGLAETPQREWKGFALAGGFSPRLLKFLIYCVWFLIFDKFDSLLTCLCDLMSPYRRLWPPLSHWQAQPCKPIWTLVWTPELA